MADLPERFSPEWDKARAEFYAGIYETVDEALPPYDEVWNEEQRAEFDAIWGRHKDTIQVRAVGGLRRNADPDLLRKALVGLRARAGAAHDLAAASMGFTKQQDQICEVLSDAGLIAQCLAEMLSPWGDPLDLALIIRQRRPGRGWETFNRARRGRAIGAEIARLMAEQAHTLDSAQADIHTRLGISRAKSRECYADWVEFTNAHERFG